MKHYKTCPVCSNFTGTNSTISSHMRQAHKISLGAFEKLDATQGAALVASAPVVANAAVTRQHRSKKRVHARTRPAIALAAGSGAPLAQTGLNAIKNQVRSFFNLSLEHPEIRGYWLSEIETRRQQLETVVSMFPAPVERTMTAGG